jgi:hypothetical protein
MTGDIRNVIPAKAGIQGSYPDLLRRYVEIVFIITGT